MFRRLLFPLALALFTSPLHLVAASAENLEQEYQQVRKIALRDAKVSAAYEEADRRLNAKIAQIDPALATYATTRARGGNAPAPATAAPRAKPVAKTPPAPAHGATHTVAKGETLGGIAAKYGVSVASLKTANYIQDERKLRAGQVLTIPGAKAAPAAKNKGWWDRLTTQ